MINFIIKGIYAVGMHHWSQRSLEIDDILYVKNKPENHFDKYAVAIFKDRGMKSRCAYLQKNICKSYSAKIRGKLATWFGIL